MVQRKPVDMEGWPRGMDNRRKDYDLWPAGGARDVLRNAVNVDILSSGKPRLRYGPRQVYADSGAHSGFTDGRALFWGTGSTIKRATPGSSPATLLTDSRLATPLSWLTVNGDSYFSNELVNGMVNGFTGLYEPWGIVPPASPPAVQGDGGSRYVAVTCAFLASRTALDGTTILEESGAPQGVQVLCSDNPSLKLTAIPQSTDSRVVATRIYATGLDGKEYFRVTDVQKNVLSITLTPGSGTAPTWGEGEALKTLLNSNPPPGQLIEYGNGSIYIAQGNVVWQTEPLRYGMIDNDAKFFYFPQRVTMMKFVPRGPSRMEQAGLFVAADKTYFLENVGTKEVEQKIALEYGAIEGAAMHLPNSDDVMWLSTRGFVKGVSGGKVQNLTESQIAMDQYSRAAMGMLERDGHRAVITVGVSSTATPLLSQDWIADEAERTAEVE